MISVIIPAYNVETCLRRCLDSVFAQSAKPTEVIVVNDGSTDGTSEAARSYAGHIAYLEQSNQGQGAARNAGLRIATGEYVALLDADDYWMPDFLEKTAGFLAENDQAVAVSTGYVVNRRGVQHFGPAGLLTKTHGDATGYILDNFFDTWAQCDHVRTGTVLMRRSVIERAGPQLGIRISQDLEYWGYVATFGPWGFLPRVLWVGDSNAHAMRVGWMSRYRQRRKACPTVGEWEQRIAPRLRLVDWPGFRIVRGRVAAHFAHNMILAGNGADARKIVAEYGADMGADRLARILRLGCSCGLVGWAGVCAAVRLRECAKACSAIRPKIT